MLPSVVWNGSLQVAHVDWPGAVCVHIGIQQQSDEQGDNSAADCTCTLRVGQTSQKLEPVVLAMVPASQSVQLAANPNEPLNLPCEGGQWSKE